jgi:hypothetical protein
MLEPDPSRGGSGGGDGRGRLRRPGAPFASGRCQRLRPLCSHSKVDRLGMMYHNRGS